MNSSFDIVSILRKKMEGTICDEEQHLLEEWVAEDTSRLELLKNLEDEEAVLADLRSWLELRKRDHDTWLEQFEEKTISKLRLSLPTAVPIKQPLWRKYVAVVAMVFAIIGAAFWYYQVQTRQEQMQEVVDLAPGTNKAQIKLGDGRTIELSANQDGVVLGEDLQYEDGTLIAPMDNSKLSYATISTPKGGKYHITLSDGTRVWLNAASELKYPIRFDTKARQVELIGEAYFDVATLKKNGHKVPFIVKTNKQEVEVLGTQFNLKSYADDDFDTQTTLVEGSVALHRSGKTLHLLPGEQGIIAGPELHKKKVDVGQYIAWKDNQFVFEEVELTEVLKVLSRWYDFDFKIDKNVKATHIYANMNRNKSLKEVLSILESSGIKFKLARVAERNILLIYN